MDSILGIVGALILLVLFYIGVAYVVRKSSRGTDPVSHSSPNTQPPDSFANSQQIAKESRKQKSTDLLNKRPPSENEPRI